MKQERGNGNEKKLMFPCNPPAKKNRVSLVFFTPVLILQYLPNCQCKKRQTSRKYKKYAKFESRQIKVTCNIQIAINLQFIFDLNSNQGRLIAE